MGEHQDGLTPFGTAPVLLRFVCKKKHQTSHKDHLPRSGCELLMPAQCGLKTTPHHLNRMLAKWP
jgi:hypothetical protein